MINEQRLKDFIDTDLKSFSNHDNVRSIPSLIDGFKDSQRKAVYGMIKQGKDKIKVSQMASACALLTNYAHGEGSLASTIIGLAQAYPGANNINLFEPIGQFGSILTNESASPRYIYTKQSKHLRTYLREEDDAILDYHVEEGQTLEPVHYLPIIPMWILNGTIGVGTGHSSKILARYPASVIAVVKKIIKAKGVLPNFADELTPHFSGWKGTVTKGDSETQWVMTGVLEKVNTTTIRITELPVQYGVDKYKEILIDLMDQGIVKDFDNNSTEESFDFVVSVPREIGRLTETQLIQKFKLSAKFGENVTLWGVDGKLKRYNNVQEALVEFVQYRLDKFQIRKDHQLKTLTEDLAWLKDKMHFINWWNTRDEPHKLTTEEIAVCLKLERAAHLDRLLGLQIRSLTVAKVQELQAEIDALEKTRAKLEEQTTTSMFLKDLDSI